MNGQAARAMLGQYSFTYASNGVSSQILGGVGGIAYVNGTLFAADSNFIETTSSTSQHNRVLTFPTSYIQDPHADLTVATNPAGDTLCGLCGYPASNVLGQVDFVSVSPGLAQAAPNNQNGSMNQPTAVATDRAGTILAVADTNNNRVLIWSPIPTTVNAPANIVLGQPNFTTRPTTGTVNASSLRGPQGVWIENGKLFVADTGNYRVLIWNTIPTTNNQPADLVLGQPNFTTVNQPPVTKTNPTATAAELSNPVSVTSDGTHLFVSDLGFNRVLIWNNIPTTNDPSADVVIGQPDMSSTAPNNSGPLCGASSTTDTNGNTVYPACANSLNFPRFALSDGTRLFVADGGNDRVLLFNTIPTSNGAAANIVLGQPDFSTNLVTNQSSSIISTTVDNTGSVDTIATPMSLAYDGTNLYVADANNSRVLVYTPADTLVQPKSVLNAASKITRQTGFVTLALPGSITSGDTVSITIGSTPAYTYTLKSSDTLATITTSLINLVNAGSGDPNVIALQGAIPDTVFLDSRSTTAAYDSISLSATTSDTTNLTATASGSYLAGGNAGVAAPGAIVEIDNPGGGLSDETLSANSQQNLPKNLGGVQVYMDGNAVPLFFVSPTQVIAQLPNGYADRNSSSVYVRTVHTSGSVTVTNATPVIIAYANPGLFGQSGNADVRPAYGALHQAGNPSATVSIDGTATAGDKVTITVNSTNYNYTVQSGDVLVNVVNGLIAAINAGSGDPSVVASAGGAFTRVLLTARQSGAAGSGVPISGTAAAATSSGTASETVSAYQSATCCSTTGTGLVTTANPAQPNETITFLATGLGGILLSDGVTQVGLTDGIPYEGVQPTSAGNSVAATVNGVTGEVVSAGIAEGGIGVYAVNVIMPSSLTANAQTPVYIAQNAFISNTVTLPVGTSGSSATPINTTLPALPWETGSTAVNAGIPAVPGSVDQQKLAVYPVIWQPSNSTWTRLPSNGIQDRQTLGQPGDIPAPGDYDGDGTVDFAVYRPSNATFYVIPSSNPSTIYTQQWGQPGDVPVPQDYEGANRTNYALFRPSTAQWMLISSLNPTVTLTVTWGQPGDIPVPGDYDGNRVADLAVFRPSTGQWLLRSNINPSQSLTLTWGQPGDIPVPGDYDGDGIFDLAVFRPSTGTWILRSSANPGVYLNLQWGQIGDIPVPGDYDGDGIFDAAVYRPSTGTWIIRPSSNPGNVMNIQLGNRLSIPANAPYNAALKWKLPNYPVNWQANGGSWTIPSLGNPLLQSAGLIGSTLGQPGDIPVPGDWDGDGIIDFAVWRPSNGTWYVVPSSNPSLLITQVWGQNGDVPVPGDYDGDGKLDFAFWRPSTGQYYLISSRNPALTLVLSWGQQGDIPAPGDYDGDRVTDLAVYRPSTGQWILRSSANPLLSLALPWGGQPGDIPVPGDYDGDGLTDLAIYRPSTGQWILRSSINPSLSLTVAWGGQPGDIPVPGDYDGDGLSDPAFWRPSAQSWNVRPSSNPSQPLVNVTGSATSFPANAPNTFEIYQESEH